MSQQDQDREGKTGGLWALLRQRFARDRDNSLRDTVSDAIDSHGAEDPAGGMAGEAKSMMLNIIEFAKLRVDDVMVPRADIVAIEEVATLRTLLASFIEANHSRLPVYRETLDDPKGFVHVKDLLRWMSLRGAQKRRKAAKPGARAGLSLTAADLDVTIQDAGFMRELLFVPPSMPASDLLVNMQASHIHMAIVIDEYGGTDGLVSIEDLVEQIVGDISDEHDIDDDQLIRAEADGKYLADGRVAIEELETLLGIDLLPDEREED